jgi:hypothetical protein
MRISAAPLSPDIPMKRNRSAIKPLLCALALLALSACGGGNRSGNSAEQACTGAVRELFVAMQGSYYGVVNAEHSSGTALPLTRGKQYVVTVSACAVSIAADNNTKLGFVYGDERSGTTSTLIGLSPSQIIQEPTSLELTAVQYNVGVSGGALGYELERRVKALSTDASVADGDLFLSIDSADATTSTYGIDILASTRR